MERVSTGNARLDLVLGGGLVADAITLVVGAPGTGKTILAEQCLFATATQERPGLYLATVSEPYDKLLRYGQSLEFFDTTRIGHSVFYEDLGTALHQDALAGVLDQVDSLVKAHRPGIVVIDSFKALKAFAADEADFRRFLHDLAGRFSVLSVTSLWVGEYELRDTMESPEFAVADSVIALETKRIGERSIRYLNVRKLRGSDFLSGDHAYRLTAGGLKVFPRFAESFDGADDPPSAERHSTGIAALDEALEDGYWRGSATLIVGPTGAGKTLMGLHFIYAGASHGEPGILLTLQENRTQLARIIERFGWSFDDPMITVLHVSPVDVYVDELAYELLDLIDEVGARRVVIDSLDDLSVASPDRTRLNELVFSVAQRCAHRGVSVMFTHETVELFRITRLSEYGTSHLADNVILLQHLRDGARMKRVLSVLKTRGSTNATAVREFVIAREGITLGDPVDLGALVN
jgi:circadian clock protein KaiC